MLVLFYEDDRKTYCALNAFRKTENYQKNKSRRYDLPIKIRID